MFAFSASLHLFPSGKCWKSGKIDFHKTFLWDICLISKTAPIFTLKSADVQIKFIKIWHSEMIFIKYIKPALNYQQIKFWKGSHTISLLSFDLWNHDILNWFSDNIKQTSCRVTLSMDTRFVSLGFVKTRFPAIKMLIFWGSNSHNKIVSVHWNVQIRFKIYVKNSQ